MNRERPSKYRVLVEFFFYGLLDCKQFLYDVRVLKSSLEIDKYVD